MGDPRRSPEQQAAAFKLIKRLIDYVNEDSEVTLTLSMPELASFPYDVSLTDSHSESSVLEDAHEAWPILPEHMDKFYTNDEKICPIS